jgi:hypothetical protein
MLIWARNYMMCSGKTCRTVAGWKEVGLNTEIYARHGQNLSYEILAQMKQKISQIKILFSSF